MNSATKVPSSSTGSTGSNKPTIRSTIAELLEWNLIDRISPYLDRHMIFPLLDYFEKQIQEVGVTSNSETKEGDDTSIATQATLLRDVNEARYQLLRPTHMIDYMMDVYNSSIIPGSRTEEETATTKTVLDEMTQQKQKVLQDLESLKQQCLPLLEEIDTATRVRMHVSIT